MLLVAEVWFEEGCANVTAPVSEKLLITFTVNLLLTPDEATAVANPERDEYVPPDPTVTVPESWE